MAGVSLVPGVYEHVRVQPRLLPERHVAHVARERLLAGVDQGVPVQVRLSREDLVADLAIVLAAGV